MKKNTLLIGAFALFATSSVFAQDLVIETMKSNEANLEIVDAEFDVGYGNIGHTNLMSVIGLGEVDFGEDGSAYKATGVEFGHGWGEFDDFKYLVFHAGPTFEEAVPFNEVRLQRTYGYHCFVTYAENIKNYGEFTPPTGKQKVWLTFREGNGNLRSAIFYENELAIEGEQPWINELPDYEDKATIIHGRVFERATEPVLQDPDDPDSDLYKDAIYNEDNQCWGGIREDFIIKTREPIDFGDGGLQQLVAYIGHDGERYKEYMEFYIDEVTPENMIARTWSGISLEAWNDFTPIATKLQEVKGTHYLFVKFGAATNLHRVDLVTENLWYENPECGVIYKNIRPSEDAVEYKTIGDESSTQGGDPSLGQMEWNILVTQGGARCEGQNIGYTSNGVVVAYYDVDFKNGEYKRVIIDHSCDKNYTSAPLEECNFSLYLDLGDNMWNNVETPEEVKAALEGHEPFAIVEAQPTGGWSDIMGTAAELPEITGIHTIYVVYNLPEDFGMNIYSLFLDPDDGIIDNVPTITTETLKAYSVNGEIVINTTETVNVALYTINGSQLTSRTLAEGTTVISNLSTGLYILKATNKEGMVSTHKLMVK